MTLDEFVAAAGQSGVPLMNVMNPERDDWEAPDLRVVGEPTHVRGVGHVTPALSADSCVAVEGRDDDGDAWTVQYARSLLSDVVDDLLFAVCPAITVLQYRKATKSVGHVKSEYIHGAPYGLRINTVRVSLRELYDRLAAVGAV